MRQKRIAKKHSVWEKFLEELGKEIPLIRESRKNKLYMWGLIISLSIIIGLPLFRAYHFTKIFQPIIDIFAKNFGSLAIGSFFAVFFISFFFFSFIALSKIYLESISTIKQKWTGFFILSLTITLFLSGAVFIHYTVGAPNTEWKLFEGKTQVADISCKDSHGRLIESHKILCEIDNKKINMENTSGIISIELHNGTKIIKDFPEFVAPPNINHIKIKLNVTSNGEIIKLSTGFFPDFYTEVGERERQKNFLTYFFGLLFIVLITVPQLVIHVMRGLKEEKN